MLDLVTKLPNRKRGKNTQKSLNPLFECKKIVLKGLERTNFFNMLKKQELLLSCFLSLFNHLYFSYFV